MSSQNINDARWCVSRSSKIADPETELVVRKMADLLEKLARDLSNAEHEIEQLKRK